jgi:hypothetical protein
VVNAHAMPDGVAAPQALRAAINDASGAGAA